MQTNISATAAAGSVGKTTAVDAQPAVRHFESIALAAGPIAAILIAGLASGVRSQVGSTNVALVLTCVVVAASMAGRLPGVVTALTAALSYNFFHTAPYKSLRINDAKDLVTVLLLVAIGLITSEISARRRQLKTSTSRHVEGQRMLEATAALVAADKPLVEVWAAIKSQIVHDLRIADCRFQVGPPSVAHVLTHTGSLSAPQMRMTPDGFELPAGGVAVPVTFGTTTFGQIILVAKPDSGTSIEERRVAVALADHLAIALWRAGDGGAPSIASD